MTPRLHPGARMDLERGQDWYRRQGGPSLGRQFRDAFAGSVRYLIKTPRAGAPWPGVDPKYEVRRHLLPAPWSDAIAYVPREHSLLIVAIAHRKRWPDSWLERARLERAPRR